MDLREGFVLDEPPVTIPWSLTPEDLRRLMGTRLRAVTRNYFTVSCRSLGRMEHELGFHFAWHDSAGREELKELEFYRRPNVDLRASFDDFQRHFETAFGNAVALAGPVMQGWFPEYQWDVPGAYIRHYVLYRFGAEEHLRMSRKDA